jgi:hypothetical protein
MTCDGGCSVGGFSALIEWCPQVTALTGLVKRDGSRWYGGAQPGEKLKPLARLPQAADLT